MEQQLYLGNEAVARGLFEAGCAFVSSYPGTPSTEITEYAAQYREICAEWAPNEKVAAEAAVGASIIGARAFTGMKHVGLNVAADPLFTASYTGVNGGLVIGVADDMGIHSSQNEQDSRHYAIAAKMPMLEPSDSQECLDYTKLAFSLSEQFDTPVFLRLSTRISHARSLVRTGERDTVSRKPYQKNIEKYVMMPANARKRHVVVEHRTELLRAWAERTAVNTVVYNDRKIGVVAAGIAYQTAREALGDAASYCKLGMVHPLPIESIRAFAEQVEALYIIEELDDVIERQVKAEGIDCRGKSLFGALGEYTVKQLRRVILGESGEPVSAQEPLPARPPALCPGCPHRGVFHVLNKKKLFVSGDIGCYTLGAAPPLSALDTTLCMGASISGLHGVLKASGLSRAVAVIGDSTFLHSGITGLMNCVYNHSAAPFLILDNSTTGMTGHQPNPSSGCDIYGEPAYSVDLEALCRAVGVKRVVTLDAHDLAALDRALDEELAAAEPSVIIARRPCVLLKTVKRGRYLTVGDTCKNCGACLKISCPALASGETGAVIDPALCVGCGLCRSLCRFDAIREDA